MTKVNCTYMNCKENGTAMQGKRGNDWEYRFCQDHAKKMRPLIEQTGPYKPKVKLNPPLKEKVS